jgi:hypothetical protein
LAKEYKAIILNAKWAISACKNPEEIIRICSPDEILPM